MQLTICTQDKKTLKELEYAFVRNDNVRIYYGSCFDIDADMLVSPANSFGIMDGGFDKEILDALGSSVQDRVFEAIKMFNGEINIGDSMLIRLHKKYKFLLVAPTMRVPMDVSKTTNAYVAIRRILWHLESSDIVMPMLCTGIGKMPVERAVNQMRMAYRNVVEKVQLTDFDLIRKSQERLMYPNDI